MSHIKYKNKKYITRTFNVLCQGAERTYKISVDSLYDAIEKNIEDWDEKAIDNQIYFYVEDAVIKLKPEDICKNHLDIEMVFISEENG